MESAVENNDVIQMVEMSLKSILKLPSTYLWGINVEKGNVPPLCIIYNEKFYMKNDEEMYLTDEEMKNFDVEKSIEDGSYALMFEGQVPEELRDEVKYWGNRIGDD